MSDDEVVRATIAEDRCRELELERDKWKDAFNNAIVETRQCQAAANRVRLPRQERAHYADAESPGEAQALRREEHLCNGCLHAHVCEVAATLQRHADAMPTVWRCNAFIGAEELRALEDQE